MGNLTVEYSDGELRIDVGSIVDKRLLREISKHAVFDETLIEFVCKMLVDGRVEWDGDDTCQPWYVQWTGKGDVFEKARREVARLSDDITQKLVADLTEERDRLHSEASEIRDKIAKIERQNKSLLAELDALSEPESDSPFDF